MSSRAGEGRIVKTLGGSDRERMKVMSYVLREGSNTRVCGLVLETESSLEDSGC
jgi:hypothetical protein